jgi:hypothetical protein
MINTYSVNDNSLLNIQESNIQGIFNSTIYEYFAKLNNNEFISVAELFAEQGCLTPPFDKILQGRSMILQYLEREAKDIKSYPKQGETAKKGSLNEYQIQGTVEISQFILNVTWFIQLNSDQEIISLEVKLTTSLEDLLDFK